MKILAISLLSLLAIHSYANDSAQKDWNKKFDQMSFEDARKMKLDMLEKKTNMIETEKSCIINSKDKAGLKMCMQEMWDSHKEMKQEMKDKMKMN